VFAIESNRRKGACDHIRKRPPGFFSAGVFPAELIAEDLVASKSLHNRIKLLGHMIMGADCHLPAAGDTIGLN